MKLRDILSTVNNKLGAIKIGDKPRAPQKVVKPPNMKAKPQGKGKGINKAPQVTKPEKIKVSTQTKKKPMRPKGAKPSLTGQPLVESRQKKIQLDERVKQRAKDGRFMTFRMYSYKLFNYLLKGSLDHRDPNLNGDSIQIGYSNIFTLSTVSRYFVISHLPEDIPVSFMNKVIREIKRTGFWTNVSIQVVNRPYRVDLYSTNMKSKLENWSKYLDRGMIEDTGEVEGLDGQRYATDFEMSRKIRFIYRMFRSYFKIKENINFVKESAIIIKLQTRERDQMDVAEKVLRQSLESYNIQFYKVKGTLLDFLRGFSPVSKRRTVSSDTTNRLVMTARDIADLYPYRQGKIGDWGIWFGTDKLSGANVWLDIMGTPEAKNILVMGTTGSGKSFFVSMLLVFHNALKHSMFIHDHKGTEFTEFAKSVNGIIISMTPSKSSYISMWILPINEVNNESELRALYTEFFGLAELEFLTLTTPEPENMKLYKDIFNDFHTYVQRKAEVHPDKLDTYYNTTKITPRYLWDRFEEFYNSQPILEVYDRKVLISMASSLYKYWHESGSRNELYRNEIKMEDINNNRVICMDFGMHNTTKNSVPPNELKLKKIFMNVAKSRYVNSNKKKGKWTVNVVEEIQSADEDILKFTSDDITEGRAKNMINYVLGNAKGTLTSKSEYAQNIVDNMNIQIIGKLYAESREYFLKQYGLEKMEKHLRQIANNPKYQYCFLLNCTITKPTATAIVQMVATSNVEESKYFKTVDYEKRD